jgi:hypothetical protein
MKNMSQNLQHSQNQMNGLEKRPTCPLSGGKAVVVPPCSKKSFAGVESYVRKKMKSKLFILLLLCLVLSAASCKTKEVPGRRRAPRNCNTCTKWSYAPQKATETLLLNSDEA